jgi:hypothetical protein
MSDTEHGSEVRQRRARVGATVGDDLIKCAPCERYGGRHSEAAGDELPAERSDGRSILASDRQRADLIGSARGDPAHGPPGEQLRGSRGGD